MECRLRQIGKNWHAAFKHGGTDYTHSLRTQSEHEAEVRLGVIRDTLYRLETGTLQIPANGNAKMFIVSGGQVAGKQPVSPRLTIDRLSTLYMDSLQATESNTRLTLKIHLAHLRRILKSDTTLESVTLADVDRYARTRLKEQHHGRTILGRTVKKELETLRTVWTWAYDRGHTPTPPTWKLQSVQLPKDKGRESFKQYKEISTIIGRGKVSEAEQARLWETLYLTGQELQELLVYVRDNATAPWVYPMVAMVAMTGCRRSEMVRSRIDDWDMGNQVVHVREKKRDTSVDYTTRTVDVHPQLSEIMQGWFKSHPGGQHAITADGSEITIDMATDHLNRTLQGHEKWSKVRGFHTLRHTLASILASKGVDQRYIDKMMGHQTDDMRKRYQHLFPKGMESAINSLLG
jgi:integrase